MASSELRVSDKTKSHDVEADSHVLLWPLEFKGRVTRRLSDWCTAIPAVSVACRMNRTQVKMNHMSLKKNFFLTLFGCGGSDAVQPTGLPGFDVCPPRHPEHEWER